MNPGDPGEKLAFDPVAAAPGLPANFMPAGLAALADTGGPRLVVRPRRWTEVVDFRIVTAAEIVDFQFWMQLDIDQRSPENPVWFGPPTAVPALRFDRALNARPAEISAADAGKTAVVVIDHGIAFWNARFRRAPDGRPRFRAMQYLDFDQASPDGTDPGQVDIAMLSETEIARLCATSDVPGGQAKVIDELARRFPGSLYAQDKDPDAFWHGTAMADLAVGSDPAAPDDRLLFGLELPAAAVRDSGGDTLQAVLPVALSAAMAMTSAAMAQKVVIVLAFGFPAGPHDGSHPIAQVITEFLTDRAHSGPHVTLVIPAGNHRQDQCAARLPAAFPTGPAPSVTWRMAPEDHSPGTVEILVPITAEAPQDAPVITLTAPDGGTTTLALPASSFAALRRSGQLIGGLHRLADRNGWVKLRLSLLPTVWKHPGRVPAPFGDWQIAVRARSEARLWILRDDRDRVMDRATPHRPSVFVAADYPLLDAIGAPVLTDLPGAIVCRAGTASVLTTAQHPDLICVQADAVTGNGTVQPADYSGQMLQPWQSFAQSETVEDARNPALVFAVANGSPRQFRISGTSAAAAMAARKLA